MTIWILIIAVLWDGQIYFMHYGADKPVEFPTKAVCEKKLATEQVRVPKDLKEGATLLDIQCVEKPKDGQV